MNPCIADMGSGKWVDPESIRSHLERAESADERAERKHHVREALQLLEGVERR